MLARVLFDFNAATPVWSIVLGLWPALKAARQDPIEALRYE